MDRIQVVPDGIQILGLVKTVWHRGIAAKLRPLLANLSVSRPYTQFTKISPSDSTDDSARDWPISVLDFRAVCSMLLSLSRTTRR